MNAHEKGMVVQVENLEKRFGDFVAVDCVSFSVSRGEIFGFLGPNGAGKSTTIKMLTGILKPSGGSGTVAGFDLMAEARKIKAHIGYMSQKFSLYEDLTVEENIDFYSGIYKITPENKKQRKKWVLEMADLEEHRDTRTRILSGGWRQRLALGCAVLHEPPILFLDEPTSGVDPISRRRFWDLIYKLSEEGVTIFVTTHYMDEAEYCHRLALIYQGALIAGGSPDDLKTEYMENDVLDVVCERPQDALTVLDELPSVKEAALFGGGLHVVSSVADTAKEEITQKLGESGFAVKSVKKIVPSLEDVFVSLIESRSAERPQQEVKR
jgi:ABC-2 type transport system ATP-binding protein